MYGALILFEDQFIHIVGISFTALVLTELVMVALTVQTWHRFMVLAELLSLAFYVLTLIIFKNFFGKPHFKIIFSFIVIYFILFFTNFFDLTFFSFFALKTFFSDAEFIQTLSFFWKVVVITVVSCLPLYVLKHLRKKIAPPSYSKLS